MDYIMPKTVQEAIQALAGAKGKGRAIAGGTDALLDLEEGKYSTELLVDVTGIPELREIKCEYDMLVIGAAACMTDISRSSLVRKYAPSLAEAAAAVGSRQIGNAATLAGNVVSAQPAADGAMALATLEPEFIIEGLDGWRAATMAEMYAGFGRSCVGSTREVLTFIKVPCLKEGEASAFTRLEMRKALALPMLNVSAAAKLCDGVFEWVRIAMGPVGVGPVRAATAEKWLARKEASAENIRKAARLALKDANPRSSPLRGSREYRMQTLPVMVERALTSLGLEVL
ncbi:MAG: FAD binding domain-containing protein [Clostridiales bacterium]|nr:FAD binding domain-containing protein [Clostridiales bacterium]